MKKRLSVLILCVLALNAFAQDLPRVAVVPFNPVGVSERDASVITSLFETALVQTESFNVIEQNQIADIMEAQAYTMTGCTDESCAIEVGKLLAAEQIILGELSSIGGKFILNAKIIDVEQGRNIKADKVEAAGMGDMTSAAELLAFKLAGLTYTAGGAVQVAQAFGEALIETEPPGADIYVNGAKKGVSPDLITRIPLGAIRIEAKKGNLYAVQDITVTAETARISLTLEEQYGNLFIKSSEAAVDVYLDGMRLGPLASGFFDKLPVGDHVLELKGQDVYWSGNVNLEAGKSTRVEAYPRQFFALSYTLPEGTSAEITSYELREVVRGNGQMYLYAGKYTVKVTGERYEPYWAEIEIGNQKTMTFAPELKPVYSFELDYFTNRFVELERTILGNFNTEENYRQYMIKIGELMEEMKDSIHDYPELTTECERLLDTTESRLQRQIVLDKISVLEQERAAVQSEYDLIKDERRRKDTVGWVLLATGAAGYATAGVSAIISNSAFSDYEDATAPAEILEHRFKVQQWDVISVLAGITGSLFTAVAPISFLCGPKLNECKKSLAKLDAEIAALRMEAGE